MNQELKLISRNINLLINQFKVITTKKQPLHNTNTNNLF